MKYLILVLFFLAGSPAFSQVIAVTSGEHGAFTRLVLQFPQVTEWRFGRTEAGYEFETSGRQPRFDLSDVYRRIGKERIRSIWADPQTGRLQLGIGCACHAVIDNSQDRLVVIDIRDGAPEADHPFETTLAGNRLPPLGPARTARPRSRPVETAAQPYDWLQVGAEPVKEVRAEALERRLPISQDLANFRANLITQLDRASSDGLVRLAPEPIGPDLAPTGIAGEAQQNFGIGTDTALSRSGSICPDPADLDVSLWASGDNAFSEMSASREPILGEFDRVDRSALTAAVKVAIFYGFGVEARALMSAFGSEELLPPELTALSHLVDGEMPASNPFTDQQACPGPVALWALAAAPSGSRIQDLDADAAIQAFMALPPHLQAVLALDVAGKLQASGHGSQAEILLNTLQRSGPVTKAVMPLAAAQLSIARGEVEEAARQLAERPAAESGTPAALMLQAEANFRLGTPPVSEFVTELEALYFVEASGPNGREITRALALTRAMAGDFREAFSLASEDGATSRDLWGLLAREGSDGALLTQASQGAPDPGSISRSDQTVIARRLIELGLPSLARDWVGSGAEAPELRARLDLLQRDGRSAIRALGSVQSPEAETLRVEAFEAIGSFDRAAELAERAGKPEVAARYRRWAGEFPAPVGIGDDPWSGLTATLAETEDTERETSLAAVRTMLDETQATVARIDTLLAQTRMD